MATKELSVITNAKVLYRVCTRLNNPVDVGVEVAKNFDRDHLEKLRESLLSGLYPEREINKLAKDVTAGQMKLASIDITNYSRALMGEDSKEKVAEVISGLYETLNDPPLFDKFNQAGAALIAYDLARVAGYNLDIKALGVGVALVERGENNNYGESFKTEIYNGLEKLQSPNANADLPLIEVEHKKPFTMG